MTFRIASCIERQTSAVSEDDAYSQNRIERWVREKGYFSRELIEQAIGKKVGVLENFPAEGRAVQSTFARICNEGGHGISTDKFIAEFDKVVDTGLPYVRRALGTVRHILLFFSHFPFEEELGNETDRSVDLAGFLRALHCHAELNSIFNEDYLNLSSAQRGGRDGYKVHNAPVKTAPDLRRLLFRSIASAVPAGHEATDAPVEIPVLRFVWHEHETGPDGKPISVEHRVFELQDERTVELQDILGMSRTREIQTKLCKPLSRHAFKTILSGLPHFKHHLGQLGIDRDSLISLLTLLSHIDPHQEGLCTLGSLPRTAEPRAEWFKYLPETQEMVSHAQFDALLKEQLPYFYIQLSKLIGLLAAVRSGDGGYDEDYDDEGMQTSMQTKLICLTVNKRFRSRQLEETFFVDADESIRPIKLCLTCRELGLDHKHDHRKDT